jgi:RNA recognition motif-containing protein
VKFEVSPEEKVKKDKCTLFVGNVPLTVNKRSFESPFRQFGKIVSSRFRSAPVKEKYQKANKKFGMIRKDFREGSDEGKLSQNGYIVFADESCVKKAVESTGIAGSDVFKTGHLIRLDYVVPPSTEKSESGAVRKFDRKKSIYIPHLPSSVSEIEVQTAVESYGESLKGSVKGVRIVRSDKSGSFAFVLFTERSLATLAIKLCPEEGLDYTFGTRSMKLRFERILKEDELKQEREKARKEVQASAHLAAKKSLSRMKWQTRLNRKGISKVVSHHAMPRAERQEKMSGVARRLFHKSSRTKKAKQ